jgi:hypothetical protein
MLFEKLFKVNLRSVPGKRKKVKVDSIQAATIQMLTSIPQKSSSIPIGFRIQKINTYLVRVIVL